MRVAIVTDWMSPAGGAEAYVTTLGDALRAAGHDVATVACGPVVNEQLEYPIRSNDSTLAKLGRQLVHRRARDAVQQMVREFQPDAAVVGHFAYHLSPYALGPLAGVPHAAYLMDYKTVCPLGTKLLPNQSRCSEQSGFVCVRRRCVSVPHWLRDRPRYALIAEALDRASVLLTPSATMQARLATFGMASVVLRQPIPAPSTGYTRSPSTAPRLLYVGRLVAEKGVSNLLQAYARLRASGVDAELRIAGDGPLRAAVEQAARDTGGISVLGTLSPREVEQEMSCAWAVVVPSTWDEPYGLVALEAIVRGVPVVASNNGGLAENVQHGSTGLLVETGDVGALTSALAAIVSRAVFPDLSLASDRVFAMQLETSSARHVEALLQTLPLPARAR